MPAPTYLHLALERNLGSWNRIFGLLLLDNPNGTGFSIASTTEEIPNDQHSVAKHLFVVISRFVHQIHCFKFRPIYFAGESYAGKNVPAIGYYILKNNPHLPVSRRLNLAGVAIGNGLVDPMTQVATRAAHAYYSGLINERQKNELEKVQWEAINLTKMENWRAATNARVKVLDMLQSMTGLATLNDFTMRVPYKTELLSELLRIEEVKKALGVKQSMHEICSDVVVAALHDDFMKSVRYMVDLLVKKSKVFLYQGNFDLRDSVVSIEAWVKQ